MPEERGTLIFVHIPKTAGISVSQWLLKQYAPQEVYHVRAEQHAEAPRFSPHCGPQEAFLALSHVERARFRCVLGHFRYGLHEQLPLAARYFTVFRDPVERLLSQVGQYNRMAARGELGPDARPISPEQFCRDKPLGAYNQQAHFATGIPRAEMATGDRAAILQRARETLRSYAAVGTTERLDETLQTLASARGWSYEPPPRENVGAGRPTRGDLSPAFLREFEDRCWLDRALHRAAGELLDERLAEQAAPRRRGWWERAVRLWPLRRAA